MSVTSICSNNFYIIGLTLIRSYFLLKLMKHETPKVLPATYHDDIPNMKLASELQLDA